MKYHVVWKILAIVLCACGLLCSLAGGIATAVIGQQGLYSNTPESLQQENRDAALENLARSLANRCAARTLGNGWEEFLSDYMGIYVPGGLQEGRWDYQIWRMDGTLLEGPELLSVQYETVEFEIITSYPQILEVNHSRDASEETEPTISYEKYGHIQQVVTFDEKGLPVYYTLGYIWGPQYTVRLFLQPGAYEVEQSSYWHWITLAHAHRYTALLVLGAGLLVFVLTAVYLCCAAGRCPSNPTPAPGGLNRLPLDVYACVIVVLLWVLMAGGIMLLRWNVESFEETIPWPLILAVGGMAYTACLLFVGFGFAVAAQWKLPGGYWWRHSLVGRLLTLAWRLCKKAGKGVKTFFCLLPMTWQWVLTATGLGLLLLFGFALRSEGLLLLTLLLGIAVMVYVIYAFGVLMRSARRMSRDELQTKVEDKLLVGSFREFAGYLNTLADVAVVAAKKQMKSERMRAELVTNVSHDIKTPLTSIINYVDLLQKTNDPEEAKAYLEVLQRQSNRMKKLIEDLIEMSKASTGNMTVELETLDAREAINQALGEFGDKLGDNRLIPVFHAPQNPVMVTADGRLTWRVLSNLLSNAVKYALPGTRLYVDVTTVENRVLVSFKNISREQLNVDSEELMERFNRGDASRNTEGSGLGLNIARSLMELQKGQLLLLVDGDLFKVTLVFPRA